MDRLYYKWHHCKHDWPKPYMSITIKTVEGKMISGYVTKARRFSPHRMKDADGLEKIVAIRWKYDVQSL